jgi:predicted RNA-binding Zn-ribbon protein involved in translation (DUF1610 family)
MSDESARGYVYWCPVCGVEVLVLARAAGRFSPRCCNTDMVLLERRVAFWVCPVCRAEIAVLKEGSGEFRPVCCNVPMVKQAA